ncbi:hypothetical protein M5E88_02600 [Akkermansia muciniphila]|nr:hypothetical protein M5E88_02600 [Akkermansia muciniphila]
MVSLALPPWAYAYYVRLMAPGKNQLWPALERHWNNPSLAGWKWLKNCRVETPEGGFIEGFSTNHAGKAEGWHGRVTDEFKDERKEQEEEDPAARRKPVCLTLTSLPGMILLPRVFRGGRGKDGS